MKVFKSFEDFDLAMREVSAKAIKSTLPLVQATPKPVRQPVTAKPSAGWKPVNKQAALVTARASWISRPPAEEAAAASQNLSLVAELRTARLANAELGATVCKLREAVKVLRAELIRNRAALVAVCGVAAEVKRRDMAMQNLEWLNPARERCYF